MNRTFDINYPTPRRHLGAASSTEGAQDRALGSDCPAPSATWAPHPPRGCKMLRPRPRLPPPCPFLITLTNAQGAQDCTFDSDCPTLDTAWAPYPAPKVHRTAPSTRNAATGLHLFPPNLRQGYTKTHLQQQLPHSRRHLGAISSTEGAQDLAIDIDCPALGATPALHPTPRVHRTAPSAAIALP